MNYQLLFPGKIIFQNGSVNNIGSLVKSFGKKALLLTGKYSLKKNGYLDIIQNSLKENRIDYCIYNNIPTEPSPIDVDGVVDFALHKGIEFVISIGGGSVIDTGKAVSGLVTNQKGVENYLEGVGCGFTLKNPPLPFIAVPTTAGSGAEATKNAVITDRVKKYKKSFRDDKLIANLIIADANVTLSLGENETFFGGMDALSQLIESFITKKANNYCKALSSYHIPLAIASLQRLKKNPTDIDARSNMLQCSINSGITLANSGLGAIHGFASGIGGMFDIPHGLICAILLPHMCQMNYNKNKILFNDLINFAPDIRSQESFLEKLFKLNDELDIPRDFKAFNINKILSKEIVKNSIGSSMSGNPIDFSTEELEDFINTLI